MLTAYPSSENAMAALKLGAFDLIVKGLDQALAVHRGVRQHRKALTRRREVAQLRARIAQLESSRPQSSSS